MSGIATLTIIVGALVTAGGLQELIVQGILNNLAFPLLGGTLGTVAGAFVLATGIAILPWIRGSSAACGYLGRRVASHFRPDRAC